MVNLTPKLGKHLKNNSFTLQSSHIFNNKIWVSHNKSMRNPVDKYHIMVLKIMINGTMILDSGDSHFYHHCNPWW
jgi:hypothetical protein